MGSCGFIVIGQSEGVSEWKIIKKNLVKYQGGNGFLLNLLDRSFAEPGLAGQGRHAIGKAKIFSSTLLGSGPGTLQIKLTKEKLSGEKVYYVYIWRSSWKINEDPKKQLDGVLCIILTKSNKL